MTKRGNRYGDDSTKFSDEDYQDRIRAQVMIDANGCWIWQGFTHYSGYGEMSYRCRSWRLHRLAYFLWKGPIPPGRIICHTCDVRNCCNPEHLVAGTHKDNQRDALEKGRHFLAAKTVCKNGHPLAGDNVYVSRSGWRSCRTCDREYQRKRWHQRHELKKGPPHALKAFCINGHPLSGDNLSVTSNGRRRCRACHRMHIRNEYAKMKAKQLGHTSSGGSK